MIQTLYILSLLTFIISCDSPKSNYPVDNKTNNISTLFDLKEDFKFSNLTEFKIDTFNWETRPEKYQELDSLTFYMVWQGGERDFVEQGDYRDYLYSWQERNTNFIEFTILTQDENNYCDYLTYCIYDKDGIAIDEFIISYSCSEGGVASEAFGKFTDKNTCEQLCIESEVESTYTLENKNIEEGDSTLYRFTIDDNGKVTEKEIYKKHFTNRW